MKTESEDTSEHPFIAFIILVFGIYRYLCDTDKYRHGTKQQSTNNVSNRHIYMRITTKSLLI